ncbi:carbonic anhydrase [Trichocoleus sp. FACHB-262]|uniref:carbonic anhydrase n=1 Tax=Trichocoleus sp. FACHB-262 TaxID=2692869 RepID=UPI0016836168|nr:carbonic anhydrase [Trichocoleus sp. FACHB-262]MBD2122645.1 carbonic anhydrase [Trichocoleus sp. FACHB-262]
MAQQQSQFSRRNMLKFGAGALGSGAIAVGLGAKSQAKEPAVTKPAAQPAAAKPKVDKKDLTPDQALKLLMDGNKRFVTRKLEKPRQDWARIQEVAKGQNPFAAVLSCADSRIPSEIVFDQGFGDLFVCRVAGNVATPEEIGSLEFGAAVLGTKVIMVIGHERCGAVEATMKGAQVPGQIGSLIDAIKPALSRANKFTGDPLAKSVKANVSLQVSKLKASTVLADLIASGQLKVVGAYYDLDAGTITLV